MSLLVGGAVGLRSFICAMHGETNSKVGRCIKALSVTLNTQVGNLGIGRHTNELPRDLKGSGGCSATWGQFATTCVRPKPPFRFRHGSTTSLKGSAGVPNWTKSRFFFFLLLTLRGSWIAQVSAIKSPLSTLLTFNKQKISVDSINHQLPL